VAASIAVGLYLLHNVFYAAFAYLGGWLSDHVPNRRAVLSVGYGLAVVMALVLMLQPTSVTLLAIVFALAGIVVGVEEALEDSLAAELVSQQQHGMAFGSLAAVNAVGDFASSLVVGFLWSRFSAGLAFSVAGILFLAGTILMLRTRQA
jgi:MFS family permease